MKIAIRGHESKGKEVIQILESLGGKNVEGLTGTYESFYYINDKNEIGDDHKKYLPPTYKLYTLEEFEKEFPFKIGDIVLLKWINKPYEIIALELYMDKLCYKLDNGLHYNPNTLTIYKEMKEERNITLTLDKAKEWYKKGGELREIALQAFAEKELNPLPRSWNEFCRKYKFACLSTRYTNMPLKYDALIKLEQLRDCYNNSCNDTSRIAIINNNGNIELYVDPPFNCFLTFKNHLLAREFFSNFKEIIEIAKELI